MLVALGGFARGIVYEQKVCDQFITENYAPLIPEITQNRPFFYNERVSS